MSHILNGMLSHALLPPLEHTALNLGARGASETPPDLRQLMREIEASRLFALPPVVAPIVKGAPGAGPVAGIAPLNLVGKIRLLGTVVGDAAQSLAVVEELASKRQGAYRLHDQIAGLGEIVAVKRESIVVGQGELQEELFLDILQKPTPPPSAATVPVGTVVAPGGGGGTIRHSVDRAELTQMLNDVPGLMTQARAVPFMNGNKIDGFRLDFIMKGSFFEKLGLQAGDVLQRINGVELRDPGTALGLFQQLRSERNVAVDVLRNNQRTTLAYDIRG